jgi:hypothetical protein
VLVDDAARVVGTSAIISKHGTPEMPHLFLRVGQETRVSTSTGVRVTHTTLQLGASYDGPTELGSLVLRAGARGRPGWPGKLLSWGRFTFIARHRGCFEKTVLAEMRAAIDAQGRSAFWDAFGRRFTGMSYSEADHRSAADKSFVLDLFPATPFYASLLAPRSLRSSATCRRSRRCACSRGRPALDRRARPFAAAVRRSGSRGAGAEDGVGHSPTAPAETDPRSCRPSRRGFVRRDAARARPTRSTSPRGPQAPGMSVGDEITDAAPAAGGSSPTSRRAAI